MCSNTVVRASVIMPFRKLEILKAAFLLHNGKEFVFVQ